ncbi:hypothetical protein CsSME_00038080 [Camellia sinensis var. sinensis]
MHTTKKYVRQLTRMKVVWKCFLVAMRSLVSPPVPQVLCIGSGRLELSLQR